MWNKARYTLKLIKSLKSGNRYDSYYVYKREIAQNKRLTYSRNNFFFRWVYYHQETGEPYELHGKEAAQMHRWTEYKEERDTALRDIELQDIEKYAHVINTLQIPPIYVPTHKVRISTNNWIFFKAFSPFDCDETWKYIGNNAVNMRIIIVWLSANNWSVKTKLLTSSQILQLPKPKWFRNHTISNLTEAEVARLRAKRKHGAVSEEEEQDVTMPNRPTKFNEVILGWHNTDQNHVIGSDFHYGTPKTTRDPIPLPGPARAAKAIVDVTEDTEVAWTYVMFYISRCKVIHWVIWVRIWDWTSHFAYSFVGLNLLFTYTGINGLLASRLQFYSKLTIISPRPKVSRLFLRFLYILVLPEIRYLIGFINSNVCFELFIKRNVPFLKLVYFRNIMQTRSTLRLHGHVELGRLINCKITLEIWHCNLLISHYINIIIFQNDSCLLLCLHILSIYFTSKRHEVWTSLWGFGTRRKYRRIYLYV